MLATLIIKNDSAQSRNFLAHARTLPYVDVVEERRRFKPEVEEALRKSEQGEDLVACENLDDMFAKLGLKYAKTRIRKTI